MADQKQPKSKYTVDRKIPGAFEGETVTRRRAMVVAGQAAGGIGHGRGNPLAHRDFSVGA